MFGYDNDRIIQKLIYDNSLLLTVCLMHSGEYYDGIIALLIQLKESNFTLAQHRLTGASNWMIQCNACFYDSSKKVLKTQNPLLERVITEELT